MSACEAGQYFVGKLYCIGTATAVPDNDLFMLPQQLPPVDKTVAAVATQDSCQACAHLLGLSCVGVAGSSGHRQGEARQGRRGVPVYGMFEVHVLR